MKVKHNRHQKIYFKSIVALDKMFFQSIDIFLIFPWKHISVFESSLEYKYSIYEFKTPILTQRNQSYWWSSI